MADSGAQPGDDIALRRQGVLLLIRRIAAGDAQAQAQQQQQQQQQKAQRPAQQQAPPPGLPPLQQQQQQQQQQPLGQQSPLHPALPSAAPRPPGGGQCMRNWTEAQGWLRHSPSAVVCNPGSYNRQLALPGRLVKRCWCI